MAKIYAPNKQYTGISAGVPFSAGAAECEDATLLNWFREHGYRIEEVKTPDPVISDLISRAEKLKLKLPDGLTVEQVRAAVEQAEADKAAKEAEKAAAEAAKAGASDGNTGK